MFDRAKPVQMTVDEYLEQEESASVRHEFIDGYVFAMSGATQDHNLICSNLLALFHAHLRGTGCRAYLNGMKLRTESPTSFYYPDVVVTCEPHEGKSVCLQSPALLAEVLSPSTKAIDKREKMIAYKKVPSVQEYLVVYADRQRIELHQRKESLQWEFMTLGKDDILTLASLPNGPLEISVSSIYEGTNLPSFVREEEEEAEYATSELS